MKRATVCLCISALLILMSTALTGSSFAQAKKAQTAAPAPASAMRIMELKLKSGMGLEFENWLKTDIVPSLKKSPIAFFSVWKIEQFGDPDKYYLVLPMTPMAQLDQPNPFMKQMGPEGATALMAKIQRFVDSSRFYFLEGVPGLTVEPKPGYAVKFAVLVTNYVAPGREPEFERNSKEIMAIVAKTNAKGFMTSKLGLGGNPNQYSTLVPFDSFSDMGQFAPAFAKAVATAKLSPEAGIVTHREYEVIREISELSFEAPAQPAAK